METTRDDMVNLDYRKELLDAAERYRQSHKISLATLGNKVASDYRFFTNLKKGSSCTVDTFQRVLRWFEENTLSVPKRGIKSNANRQEILG